MYKKFQTRVPHSPIILKSSIIRFKFCMKCLCLNYSRKLGQNLKFSQIWALPPTFKWKNLHLLSGFEEVLYEKALFEY